MSMQLIIATVQDRDADTILSILTTNGQRLTRLSSTGGFLQQGTSTMILGLDESLVPETLRIIQKQSRRRSMFMPSLIGGSDPVYGPADQVEVEIGGAAIFVLPVEQFEQF
jgi:uncharacterized protein YaaQ